MHFSLKYICFCCLFSAYAFAEDQNTHQVINSLAITCPTPVQHEIAVQQKITHPNAVTIISNASNIARNEVATFSGDVIMITKNQRLKAEILEFNRLKESFSAQGNIHFQADNIDVLAHSISANNTQKTTSLNQSSYQLANNPAHGSAKVLHINQYGDLTLQDSTFTTCQEEQPDWLLEAGEIYISTNQNIGEAYNAKLKIFGVPVLYIPYFSFPVTNERKSGFLYPKIGTSNRSGFEISTPFYWNIAANMDATLTPKYMSKRGLQWLTEFRYLSGLHSGSVDVEYLHNDHDTTDDDARYLARLQHTGTFSDNFRLYADYTTLSDDNYLVDIGSEHYNANDAYLYQLGELSYFANNWQATIKIQDFEVLGDHVQSYKTIPQVEFTGFKPLPYGQSSFDFYSEYSRFETADLNLPKANRYHIETGFNLPISSPAWFINSEVKLLQTYYQQRFQDQQLATTSTLAKQVSRTLPKLRIHAGLNLDRNFNYFNQDLQQTLEPQIQYLYIPYKDQSNIGIYDTTILQDDYNGLFRDRRFSGLDRIAQANQISWGLTSRIFNGTNQEILRLSLGKILYLNTNDVLTNDQQDNNINQSALAADLFYQVSKKWQISGDIQYDTNKNTTRKSEINLDYQYSKGHLIQLNHRYASNVSGNEIEQASILASARLSKDWQVVGRFTKDLVNKRSIESYAGFQYESCCWAIRLAYHRNINSKIEELITNNTHNEFDSGFMIQFVIKGLGGQQSSIGIEDMFNSSIFGYKRPYFLNN
jgi:LPS-assembly protein